jgi:hypothetical protein
MFKDRSTIDIVVIIMAVSIGGIILMTGLGAITLKIIHPELDIARGVEALSNIVTTVVGALVGFIGGRAQGKMEANGGSKQ